MKRLIMFSGLVFGDIIYPLKSSICGEKMRRSKTVGDLPSQTPLDMPAPPPKAPVLWIPAAGTPEYARQLIEQMKRDVPGEGGQDYFGLMFIEDLVPSAIARDALLHDKPR